MNVSVVCWLDPMDNYPANLAPKFDKHGAVETPFSEWWPRVKASFPNVPEQVAQYWLHEHWRNSPYAWLPSKQYKFVLVDWSSQELGLIKSRWCDWAADNKECREHGEHLTEVLKYKTALYMSQHKDFPVPPIILDNRDGHLSEAHPELPLDYLLIEGHRRFDVALYLASKGRFAQSTKLWLMTQIKAGGNASSISFSNTR